MSSSWRAGSPRSRTVCPRPVNQRETNLRRFSKYDNNGDYDEEDDDDEEEDDEEDDEDDDDANDDENLTGWLQQIPQTHGSKGRRRQGSGRGESSQWL